MYEEVQRPWWGGFRLGSVEELCWSLRWPSCPQRKNIFVTGEVFMALLAFWSSRNPLWHFGGSWGGSREFSWSARTSCLVSLLELWPRGSQSRSYSPIHHTGWMCLLDDFAKCKNCRHYGLFTLFLLRKREFEARGSPLSYYRHDFFFLFLKWLKVEKLRHVVETCYFCSAGCSPPVGWLITFEWASLYTLKKHHLMSMN